MAGLRPLRPPIPDTDKMIQNDISAGLPCGFDILPQNFMVRMVTKKCLKNLDIYKCPFWL